MKVIAFILALFFAYITFAPAFQGDDCCEDEIACELPSSSDEEDNDCCIGGACLCLHASHHLFIISDLSENLPLVPKKKVKKKGTFPEKNFLIKSFSTKTWRPPNA